MLFPESLYELSQRDQQVTWLDPLLSQIEGAAAALEVNAMFTVPDGRAALVAACSFEGLPGAGQLCTRRRILAQPPVGTTPELMIVQSTVAGAVNQVVPYEFPGNTFLLPAGWKVIARANFDLAVAVNTVRLSVFGILIPIANIQRL